ncbi:MAG: hypothetical protein IT211_12245 [Armatimonadetes bacterium]|nr:hypothetical protein [Armatimonadota bacterium]
MNIEDLISQYLDGTLSSEAEAELHHRLSVSPEARKIFRAQIALQGVARDARVLHTPSVQMRNALFSRLQQEEGMGSLTDSAASVPAALVASLLEEPPPASTGPRFAPPNHPAPRSVLAANQTLARRRRRLAAILLPLLVLVVAGGIVWQRGGFGGNQSEPSLADAQSGQDVGLNARPQATTEAGNGATSPIQADSVIAGNVGEELLAMNQPAIQPAAVAADEADVALYRARTSPAEARHDDDAIAEMDDMASEPTSLSALSGTVEDISGATIATASGATEASGGGIAKLDEDEITTPLKINAKDGTVLLDGRGSKTFVPADTTSPTTIADVLDGDVDAASPLDRDVVFSHSIPPSGGISLMGSVSREAAEDSASVAQMEWGSESMSASDSWTATAAPPPPAPIIAADLHKVNPRGRNANPSSKQFKDDSEDVPAGFAAEKSEEGKSRSKVRKIESNPARVAATSPSQKGIAAAAGPQVGADDLIGLSNSQLTVTGPATQRLFAGKSVARNAQLHLDSALTIQVTLVQKGEGKRTRGGATQLQYEMVNGKAVIDVTPLSAKQRQQLQSYLRRLGKAE